MRSAHFDSVTSDRAVGRAVAEHKSCFFSEKGAGGDVIDYFTAVEGALQIVPEGAARAALATDYTKMLEDDAMVGNALPFDELMQACAEVATRANAAARK